MRTPLRYLSLGLLALGAGCGANDSATSPPPVVVETPFRAGPLSGATVGPVAVSTTNGPKALVTGFAGRFTRLDYQTGGSENDFPIYIGGTQPVPSTGHIYRIMLGTGLPVQITATPRFEYNPRLDPSGTRLAYWEGNEEGLSAGGTAPLMIMPAGGGTPTPIYSDGIIRPTPSWTPDGASLVYRKQDEDDGTMHLLRISVATGAVDTLLNLPNVPLGAPEAMLLDGVPSVLFSLHDDLIQLRLSDLDTTTLISRTGQIDHLRLSPDGRSLLYRSGVTAKVAPLSDFTQARTVISSYSTSHAEWLPDQSGIVAIVYLGDFPYSSQLILVDTLGQNQRQITNAPIEFFGAFSIGPRSTLAPSRQLIGPAGLLGDSASGILVGQRDGAALASLLTFTAADPATVLLETPTGLNSTSPFLSVILSSDRLTHLAFLNNLEGAATVVIDSTTAFSSGAVVTFNADSGTVALVLPFGGEGPPTIRDEGAIRVLVTRDSVIRLH